MYVSENGSFNRIILENVFYNMQWSAIQDLLFFIIILQVSLRAYNQLQVLIYYIKRTMYTFFSFLRKQFINYYEIALSGSYNEQTFQFCLGERSEGRG